MSDNYNKIVDVKHLKNARKDLTEWVERIMKDYPGRTLKWHMRVCKVTEDDFDLYSRPSYDDLQDIKNSRRIILVVAKKDRWFSDMIRNYNKGVRIKEEKLWGKEIAISYR